MSTFLKFVSAFLMGIVLPAVSSAQGFNFPGFAVREVASNGVMINVRSGGSGPAVVLLHGYGETGDMWVTLGWILPLQGGIFLSLGLYRGLWRFASLPESSGSCSPPGSAPS